MAATQAENQSTGDTLDKAARENFPVAPAFLPAAWRDDLMAVYGFARLVDDAGDGDLADPDGTAVLLGAPARSAQSDETTFDLVCWTGWSATSTGSSRPPCPEARPSAPAIR